MNKPFGLPFGTSHWSMDNQILHQKYLREGTAGHVVICRFYSRYTDVLARSTIVSVDDVVHEVFVSLSKTDFTKVQNVEHYVMRAIKLHCWSLLDRAIRLKALVVENTNDLDSDETVKGATSYVDHPTELDGMELLARVNLFKANVGLKETRLLNLLIDETPRSEMAALLGLKMNTLDTNIRRLRIRLVEYLRGLDYSYKAFEKFE
jgi:DNA-directed RNA polymerase specialized sigma24 family protein